MMCLIMPRARRAHTYGFFLVVVVPVRARARVVSHVNYMLAPAHTTGGWMVTDGDIYRQV